MALLLSILFAFFTQTSWAQKFHYDDYTLKSPPLGIAQEVEDKFKDLGLTPLAELQHGIPSLGLNQVYVLDEQSFVLVKYGVSGNFPLDEFIPAKNGFLVHTKKDEEVMALYFRGIPLERAKLVLHRLRDTTSSFQRLQDLLISRAHAEECMLAPTTLAQSEEITNISAHAIMPMLKSCLTGLGSGIWDSTGGVVSSAWDTMKDIYNEGPIDYFSDVADKVGDFLSATGSFVRGLVTNPEATFAKMGSQFGESWGKIKNTVKMMSTEMKIEFVCNLVGALGVDAAIVFFTAGAASPAIAGKIAMTLGNIARKFSMANRLVSILSKFGRLADQLSPDLMKRFMDKIIKNKIRDRDLDDLNNMAAFDQNAALRTMACAI